MFGFEVGFVVGVVLVLVLVTLLVVGGGPVMMTVDETEFVIVMVVVCDAW